MAVGGEAARAATVKMPSSEERPPVVMRVQLNTFIPY